MSTLVLTYRPVALLRHGYDLRVAHLCRQIEGEKHLVVVPLMPTEQRPPDIDAASIFGSVETLEVDLRNSRAPLRHLRLSESHYLQRAFPAAFAQASQRVHELLRRTRATRVIAFGSSLAELVRAVDPPHVLLDVCDSICLTVRRQLELPDRRVGFSKRLRERLHLRRWADVEGSLPGWFGQVTTINDADTQEVLRLHGTSASNVHTVPNGVGDRFLLPLGEPAADRGVAFWGNLRFPPNAEAIRYFFRDIYVPHLKARGVRLRVIGDSAPAWLLDAAASDPQIEVLGFVDDLPAALQPYPVMVNPMLIGSGMKNKVLEAFGLGLVVVSTHLGIESVPQAVAGTHHLVADKPAEFAAAVLQILDDDALKQRLRTRANELLHQHYRWEVIGRRWRELIEAS